MSGQTRTLTFDVTTTDAQTLAALKRIQKELRDTGQVGEQAGKRTAAGSSEAVTALKGLALVAAGRYALGEAEEAQQTEAITAARIKSTGNAAEISAAQQEQYVAALSKLAAVDDEVIAGGANMLRTFTNVKGEAFEPALESALDLSAAMGTDLQSATVLVGKALNDPIRGITALTRVGVTFTQQQRDQIKAMVAAGDTMGAQKLIIAELQKEFGGSAEAMATDSGRAQVAMSNAAESAGQVLAPAVKRGADMLSLLSEGFGSLPSPVQTSVIVLGAAAAGVAKLDDRLGDAGLKGTLSSNVSELGTLNTALAALGTGVAAYGATKAALDSSVAYDGDVAALTKDLEDLSAGSITAEEAVTEVGGSVEDLAKKVGRANKDSLGSRFGRGSSLTEIWRTKEANEDIKALDRSLADLARNDPRQAASAVKNLTDALSDEGVSQRDLIGLLPKYGRALEQATRHSEDLDEQSGRTRDTTQDLADVWFAHADAMSKVNDQIDRMLSAGFDEFHANDAYQQTVVATETARRELEAARKTGDPGKIAAAEEKLSDAIVDQVEAKGRQAEATAKANGQELTAAQVAEIQRGALVSLTEQTGLHTGELDVLLVRLTQVTNQYDAMTDAIRRNEDALYKGGPQNAPAGGRKTEGERARERGPQNAPAGGRKTKGERARTPSGDAPLMNVENMHVGDGVGMSDLKIALRQASSQRARQAVSA